MVYQGSKNRYAKYIIPILQKAIDDYHIDTFIDGCCGGCNIIDKIKCNTRIAIDNNPTLIALFKYAVNGGTFPETVSKEMWDKLKKNPEIDLPMAGMYAFFCSYAAKGFVGGFAAKPNISRDYYKERLNNFQKQLPSLMNINFICDDILNLKARDSVIYVDPPYINTTGYDSSKNFNYENFWNKMRELSKNNYVFISEEKAPEDFKAIWTKEVLRNSFNEKSKKHAMEKLFILKEM